MTDFEQGYQDHALALGRDPDKAASKNYQAGWQQSKSDTKLIVNHAKPIRENCQAAKQ